MAKRNPTLTRAERKHRELTATAHHEAGHAFACAWLSIPLENVSILPDGESLGRVVTKKGWLGYDQDSDVTPIVRDRIERDVMMKCAGLIAERAFLGKRITKGAEADFHKIIDILLSVSQSVTVTEAWGNYLWHRAVHIMSMPAARLAVEAIVAALLDRETLRANEVRKIIRVATEVDR